MEENMETRRKVERWKEQGNTEGGIEVEENMETQRETERWKGIWKHRDREMEGDMETQREVERWRRDGRGMEKEDKDEGRMKWCRWRQK